MTYAQRSSELYGISLAALGFLLFSLMDASSKWLTSSYHFAQISFLTFLFSLLPIGFILLRQRKGSSSLFKTQRPTLQLTRGLVLLGLRLCALLAFSMMPLADSFALILTGPIILALLAPLLLGDKLNKRQIMAIMIGFCGVLVVLRPGIGNFNIGMLGALGTAFCFALNTIMLRIMSKSEQQSTTLFYGCQVPLIVSGILMLYYGYTPPTAQDWLIFALCGFLNGLAQMPIFAALKYIPAPMVGAFQYSVVVWGVILGYFIWGDIPDAFIIIGAALIVCGGLVMAINPKQFRRQPFTDNSTQP
ncbi:DMT family transporter [Zooshikella sp. RANM57]|uniref:DMT family transporter n=1 Tax=Zooshikella sp. RANM57 TaxID=3425863 RepID=UPI003D6FC63E